MNNYLDLIGRSVNIISHLGKIIDICSTFCTYVYNDELP